jgi:hypothetical protein
MPKQFPPPTIFKWAGLFTERLPDGPIMVQMTDAELQRLTKGAKPSRGRPPRGAKGLLVMPNPLGGNLGIFACVSAGSEENVVCIPAISQNGPGNITVGGECHCIFKRDVPPIEPGGGASACNMTSIDRGPLKCGGSCEQGKKCFLVRTTFGGYPFYTCQCG